MLIVFFSLFAYFLTFFCVIKVLKNKKLKYSNFPPLKMKKGGVFFMSTNTHRIKLNNSKLFLVRDILYLKTNEKLVIFTNVKDVKIYEHYLYFTGKGEVRILFDCENFYRYFALIVSSKQFEITTLKQLAIVDLMNNGFNEKFSKITEKYIKIIEKVLNICIFKEKITVKPNKFKLSFVLTYKLNNKIKRVNIKETI